MSAARTCIWIGSRSQGDLNYLGLETKVSILHICVSFLGLQGSRRRRRTKFSKTQYEVLIEAFERDPYPDITMREELSRRIQTAESRIQVKYQSTVWWEAGAGEKPACTESRF